MIAVVCLLLALLSGHAVVAGRLDWKRRFQQANEIPSTAAEKFFLNKRPLSEGSAVFFNGSGVNWAMLDNACFQPPNKISFYRKQGQSEIIPAGWRDMRPWRFHGFGWGWRFEDSVVSDPASIMNGPDTLFVPRDSPDTNGFSGDATWVLVPPFQNHLFHVAEGVLTSFHVAQHPEDIPPMELLIGGGLSNRDMRNVQTFWDFATGPLLREKNGTGRGPRAVRTGRGAASERDAVLPRKYSRVCFERLNLLGRMMYPDMGGMFASMDAARIFRQRAYSHFHIRPMPPPKGALRVFVLRRPTNAPSGRSFTNEQAIFRVLYRLGMNPHYMDSPHMGHPERVSLEETAAWLANADIFIAPHGNGLINLLWMQEHSGVLEIVPYAFRQAMYNIKAASAGLLYDWMESSVPMKKPSGCRSHLTEWGNTYNKLGANCIDALKNQKITIDEDALESRLRFLAGNVVTQKYRMSQERAKLLALPRVALGLQNRTAHQRQFLRECCEKPELQLTGPNAR